MPGDRVKTDDGLTAEFSGTRGTKTVKFVQQRTAILALVGGLVTGGGGSFTASRFMLTAFIREEIRQHDRDPEAHAAMTRAMERIQQASQSDDAEKARLQAQLDAMQRDVREVREAVIRLEAQLRRGGR